MSERMREVQSLPSAAATLYDSGLLGEINRLVLHPRGLALTVEVADNDVSFADALNVTLDPEGFEFVAEDLARIREKTSSAEAEGLLLRAVGPERRRLFPPDGVQPLEDQSLIALALDALRATLPFAESRAEDLAADADAGGGPAALDAATKAWAAVKAAREVIARAEGRP